MWRVCCWRGRPRVPASSQCGAGRRARPAHPATVDREPVAGRRRGALGVLLAQWGLSAIARGIALNGADWSGMQLLPRAGEIRLDGPVLGFTVALSMATGVVFGLFPALRASRPDLADVLRGSGMGAACGLSGRRS